MQSVLDAASQIAAEIEKTRQRLAHLEQALESLRPLVTIDALAATLPYAAPRTLEEIEDVAVRKPRRPPVSRSQSVAVKPLQKMLAPAQRAAHAAHPTPPAALPRTGGEVWMQALGKRKLTSLALTNRVLEKLGLDDAAARLTMRNRAGAWLNGAVRKKQVRVTHNAAGLKLYQLVRD